MNYYIIPVKIMDRIKYYAEEGVLTSNISFQESELLKTLNVEQIHTNENNVIDKILKIFQSALQDFEKKGGLEDRDTLCDIIEALNKRKEAIQSITNDVLKRREDCCCN